MNSINLLPRDVIRKNNILKQRVVVMAVTLSIYAIILLSYSYFCADYVFSEMQLKAMRPRLENINEMIKRKIDEQAVPVEEEKMKNIIALLRDHGYYSSALEHLVEIINKNVYLNAGDFAAVDDNSVAFEFGAKSKDYKSAMEQVSIFKKDYWIDDVQINSFSGSEGDEIEFEGTIKFKKDVILYHDNYWKYGLALLDMNEDRSIKISNYSAETEKIGDSRIINVKFNGFAYDKEKIKQFEDFLGKASPFIKEIKINFGEKKNGSSARIEFNGTIKVVLGN